MDRLIKKRSSTKDTLKIKTCLRWFFVCLLAVSVSSFNVSSSKMSLIEQLKTKASCSMDLMSGMVLPPSHLEMHCLVTNSWSATSCWVKLRSVLSLLMFSLMFMLVTSQRYSKRFRLICHANDC